MLPLLPRVELEIWRMAVADAEELASDGDPAAGYDCLLAGFHRALDYAAAGEDWADELVRAYRGALAEHRTQYGLSSATGPSTSLFRRSAGFTGEQV
jgi:hypothetical protein